MNDTSVNVAIVIILIGHLASITIGYKMGKPTLFIAYLNAIVVIGILVFWIIKNLNMQQHYFEFRESCALCLEACILIFALYSIMGFHNNTYVKAINYIAFGLHLLLTTGMLIFMSLFKMNRLF